MAKKIAYLAVGIGVLVLFTVWVTCVMPTATTTPTVRTAPAEPKAGSTGMKATPRVAEALESGGRDAVPEGPREEYRRRLTAVQRLGPDLSVEDRAAVYAFLRTKASDQDTLEPLALNSIKNELLDCLLKQNPLPEDLGRELLSLYRDPAVDEILKDYCVQHFYKYWELRWPSGASDASGGPSTSLRAGGVPDLQSSGPVSAVAAPLRRGVNSPGGRAPGLQVAAPSVPEQSPEQTEIMDAYWDAIARTNRPMAGTALIGLMMLSRARPEMDSGVVAAKALEIAGDERRPPSVRATAIQVCGQLGATQIVAIARREAQTGATLQFRMASIATLGDLGTQEDAQLLRDLAAEQEKPIQNAATAALKRLARRVSSEW